MKTPNALILRIMVRAFKIRISNSESFEDITADYPALTTDDLAAIRATMTRKELISAVEAAKAETKSALQTVYDAMNQGQQKQIVKNAEAKNCLTVTA